MVAYRGYCRHVMLLALLPTGHHHLVCYQHEVGGGNRRLLLKVHTQVHVWTDHRCYCRVTNPDASVGMTQVKMRELGVSTHHDYKLTCMLDHKAMITVQTEKYGEYLAHAMLAVARILLAQSPE